MQRIDVLNRAAVPGLAAGAALSLAGAAIVLAMASAPASGAPLPAGWTTNGIAGSFDAADGDVSLPPGGGSYYWVSTQGPPPAPAGGGTLPSGGPVAAGAGSTASTPQFAAAAGDQLRVSFNYVMADRLLDVYGAGYDYAWAALFTSGGVFDRYLFTARLPYELGNPMPLASVVPGVGMPALGDGVALAPASTFKDPGHVFSPLSFGSGNCSVVLQPFCGHTGWVEASFTFLADGDYAMRFGVGRVDGSTWISALAMSTPELNGAALFPPLSVLEPASLALLGTGLVGMGLAGMVLQRRRRPA